MAEVRGGVPAAEEEGADGGGAAGCLGGGLARLAQGEGVDVGGANVGAVEAVGLVDLGDARVAGLGEDDVDALLLLVVLATMQEDTD